RQPPTASPAWSPPPALTAPPPPAVLFTAPATPELYTLSLHDALPISVIQVERYIHATSMLAQTTLRSIVGQVELDELLANRDKVNQNIQKVIDEHTEPWGIKVVSVEVRDVVLPESMKRVMARQAETERDRRAKVINAQGEYQAAERLVDAAKMMDGSPKALQ